MIVDTIFPISFIVVNLTCAIKACISDHKSRTISNSLSKTLFIINSIAAFYYDYFFQSATTTFVIFSILILIWLVGCFGAGDIKLLCAFTIGIKPELTIAYLVMVGLLGGVQVTIMYLVGIASSKKVFEKGIPYGIPISMSGLVFSTLSFLSF
ncbi:prepilin peptidase [Vibrio europaeus]|uniref:Peptidase n=1 Tax=Vibrio europaeus TaxID=300876 RepID=A0A178J7Y2_9VIBR|nr:prepilin peptidase [Vibrio europaeus]MDC5704984.1 prepilin peptidase [Vibrio europaeus]MDC5710263.1 prepilin peptidase [Vibrio europaeus]MDC5715353.1 prepilin peptidase [Vibrio europaeus]MDC5719514.1 prepilin peptidase [Vibrio europaeus]MDC5724598.1 prepilin peptidase [Vibrio europaeus]